MQGNLTEDTVAQLAKLTRLQVLHLPRLHFVRGEEGKLAPALSALTNLTELFIRAPPVAEQRALPTSLQELTLAPYYDVLNSGKRWNLSEGLLLQLGHLTNLRTLKLFFHPGEHHNHVASTELQQLLGAHEVAHSTVDVMMQAMPHMPVVSTDLTPNVHRRFGQLTLASFSFQQPGEAGPALTALSAVSQNFRP